MGIHDREYYRDETENARHGGSWSAVGTIIAINVAVYLALVLFPSQWLYDRLALPANLFDPSEALKLVTEGRILTLVTYGFIHDYHEQIPWHILSNMFLLWLVGSDIEGIYGKRLFWRMYLSFIVLSGLCWVLTENLPFNRDVARSVGGASGAVMGVIVVFVLHFPRRLIYLFGVLPVPVWLLGILWVGSDYLGFLGQQHGRNTGVAYAAHLGGALFGWIFYRTHFTLFSLLPTHWLPKLLGRSPRAHMRVVHPDDSPEDDGSSSLEAEVDRILAKISQQGTESLTSAEIRTLEAASRRAQRRRGARLD